MKWWLRWWIWLIILIVGFLTVTLWPLRSFLYPQVVTDKHLLLLTNEAEARPCGGFLSAYALFQAIPPKLSFHNAYALSDYSFGPAPFPLDQVSGDLKFWDLGFSPNLPDCAELFRKRFPDEGIDRAVLVNFGSLEALLELVEPVNGFTSKNLFAQLTRSVANVDRHDEESLAQRKSPVAQLGKDVARKLIAAPWLWPAAARLQSQALKRGEIFIEEVSPELGLGEHDFGVIEWNLGGAKSSRFLKKMLQLSLREQTPGNWRVQGTLSVEHVGGWDEPLSQMWKGGFTIVLPAMLGREARFFPAEIPPGETWEQAFEFYFTEAEFVGKDALAEDPDAAFHAFGIFRPRSQELFADVRISLYPQQSFADATFETHENVGTFLGEIPAMRKTFSWETIPDKTPPFVTLHEWLDLENIPRTFETKWGANFLVSSRRFSVAEIHFSEPVFFDASERETVSVTLTDKNVTDPQTAHPEVDSWVLLEDRRTLLLGFWQSVIQPNERFSIQFSGLKDNWGNSITDKEYTIIDRSDTQ
ncbi:MAG: DUF4012 domain-containing protein [Candidatus Gracilibacteria bacterium]|nr:DUF4012 domain-containing protein [Candidatus Gracilibacteria bacterium]